MIDERIQTPRFELRMIVVPMGTDLSVSLYGGDTPHIGAVALAIPHPALQTPAKIDASVSVITAIGHKEDELARHIAYSLATARNCLVSTTCGIHLDTITKDEIQDVLRAANTLLKRVLRQLSRPS